MPSIREIVNAFSPPPAGNEAPDASSVAGTDQREDTRTGSVASASSHMTRSRTRAAASQRSRESEGFESAVGEMAMDFENVQLEDVHSDIDEDLSEHEPARNLQESPPETDAEESEAGATDAEDEEENGEPFEAANYRQFNEELCRAIVEVKTAKSPTEQQQVICGKLTADCKLHKKKRKEGTRVVAGKWYPKVEALKSKDGNGNKIQHGSAAAIGLTTGEFNDRIEQERTRVGQLDPSEMEDAPNTGAESESEEESEAASSAADDDGTDQLIGQMEKLQAQIELLQAQIELQELEVVAKNKGKSPSKKPTPKRTSKPSKRQGKTTTTSIARKKEPTKKKTPKHVTIGEDRNTARSPPKDPVRQLDPSLARVEDPKSLQEQLTAAFSPLVDQMRKTVTSVEAAAQQLQYSAQTSFQRQQSKSIPIVPQASSTHNSGTNQGNDPPSAVAAGLPLGPTPPTVITPPAVVTPPPNRSLPTGMTAPSHLQDTSVGDKDKIFGMDITSLEIDDKMMPTGVHGAKDRKGLYDAMDDIASLPGTCSPVSGGGSGSSSEQVELLDRLLQSVSSANLFTVITDPGWRNKKRNGLGSVHSHDQLMDAVEKATNRELKIFRNQRLLLHRYLRERGFLVETIDEYCVNGLLPRIVKDTYRYYMALLNKLRSKRYKYVHQEWEESEVYLMLEHHAEELLEIRDTSVDKKTLIFQNYIYLRDSHAKSFSSAKLNDKINARNYEMGHTLRMEFAGQIASLQALKGGGGSNNPKNKTGGEEPLPKCSHCRCRDLHSHLDLAHNKSVCPVKDHPTSWSRKAGPAMVKVLKDGDKRPLETIVKDLSDNWEKYKTS